MTNPSTPSQTASIASPDFDTTPAQRDRSARQSLLRWAQEAGLLGAGSVASCLRHGLPNQRPRILLAETPDGRRARWSGVCRCSSSTRCVWCAPLESAKRAREINKVVHAHLNGHLANNDGRGLYMISLGVPHYRGQSLEQVYTYLDETLKRFFTGRDAVFSKDGDFQAEFGVEVTGYVCVVEINYGVNGWHPHCHVLLFTNKWIAGTDFQEVAWDNDLLGAAIGTLRTNVSILDGAVSKKLWVALTGREVAPVNIDGLGEVDPGAAYDLYCRLERELTIEQDWGSEGDESQRFALWVVAKWRRAAERALASIRKGRDLSDAERERNAYPSYQAQDVRAVQDATQIADYLTKFATLGFEVSGGARKTSKGGAAPFQLLAACRHVGAVHISGREISTDEARSLWGEYFRWMEGKRVVRWSQGGANLRKIYEDAAEVPMELDVDGEERGDWLWTEVGEVPHWAYSVATGINVTTPDEDARAEELREQEWREMCRAQELVNDGHTAEPRAALRVARQEARPQDDGRPLPPPPTGRRGDVALLDFAEADPDLTARWLSFLVSAEFHFQLSAPAPGNVLARERAVRKALRGLARGEDPWGAE